MILNGASNDFRGRSRSPIDQNHQRIFLAAVAMRSHIALLWRGAALVGNDQLPLAQKLVRHTHTFIEQATGILSQIEDQSLEIPHLVERVGNFMFRGFVEAGHVHIADAGFDHEVEIDAVTRNLIADHGELQRLVRAFGQNRDMDRAPLRSLQQVRHIAGAHVVGRFAIHRSDDVTGPDSRSIRGCSHKWCNDNDLIVSRANRHAYAVVFAPLIFAQQRIGLGIEEIGVWIEHMQHARYGTIVESFVRVHGFGVVLLYDVINRGELTQAVADVRIAAGGCRRINLLPEDNSEKSASDKYEDNQNECATRTTNHLRFPRWEP